MTPASREILEEFQRTMATRFPAIVAAIRDALESSRRNPKPSAVVEPDEVAFLTSGALEIRGDCPECSDRIHVGETKTGPVCRCGLSWRAEIMLEGTETVRPRTFPASVVGFALRDCPCVDPDSCSVAIPGYRCKAGKVAR